MTIFGCDLTLDDDDDKLISPSPWVKRTVEADDYGQREHSLDPIGSYKFIANHQRDRYYIL